MERVVLNPRQLRIEQDRTLATPPLPYGLPARLVFRLIDSIYGRERTSFDTAHDLLRFVGALGIVHADTRSILRQSAIPRDEPVTIATFPLSVAIVFSSVIPFVIANPAFPCSPTCERTHRSFHRRHLAEDAAILRSLQAGSKKQGAG